MAANSSNIVFDDIFTINAIDKEGKKFDRGSYDCAYDIVQLFTFDLPFLQFRGSTRIRRTMIWTSPWTTT